MPVNALYRDLSCYYDLMCADIDYVAQSDCIARLHKIFGQYNTTPTHLDLACGTGPHVCHFIDFGYESSGLDINIAMLNIAKKRCPTAKFSLQNMSDFTVDEPVDLVTCFLYSIHYNDDILKLKECISHVHSALKIGGVFCFNGVNKTKIDNSLAVEHGTTQDDSAFVFNSAWHYSGAGAKQSLKLSIQKTQHGVTHIHEEEHAMVAFCFEELLTLLSSFFSVYTFTHDYEKIVECGTDSANAIFVCVKK